MGLADALRFLTRRGDDPERNWLTPERHRASMEVVYQDMAAAGEGVQQSLDAIAETYLPLAGGTMVGNLLVGGGTFRLEPRALVWTNVPETDDLGDVSGSVIIGFNYQPQGFGESLRNSVSLGYATGDTTTPDMIVNTGDTYSGPWDTDRTYRVDWGSGAGPFTLDGEPLAKGQPFLPTRQDHVVSGAGLKLRRNPFALKRSQVVELGGGAMAADRGVAVGLLAYARADSSTAVGPRANANGESALALGWSARATGDNVITIGPGAQNADETMAQIGKAGLVTGGRLGANEILTHPTFKALVAASPDWTSFQAAVAAL